MNEVVARFLTEIVKPWEALNHTFVQPRSLDSKISYYIAGANALAVSIKHMPEAVMKMNLHTLAQECRAFGIISDVADSFKHGVLKIPRRQSSLTVAAMIERSSDEKFRFLRTRITIHHATYAKIDFMQCSKEAAEFVAQKIGVRTDWSPKVAVRSDEFSNEITLFSDKTDQVYLKNPSFETVQLDADGDYVNVEMNGTFKFTLLVKE